MDTASQILLGTSSTSTSPVDTASVSSTATSQGGAVGAGSDGTSAACAEGCFASHIDKAVSQAEATQGASNPQAVSLVSAVVNLNQQALKTTLLSVKAGNNLQAGGELLPGIAVEYVHSLTTELTDTLQTEGQGQSELGSLITLADLGSESESTVVGEVIPEGVPLGAPIQAIATMVNDNAKADLKLPAEVGLLKPQVNNSAAPIVLAETNDLDDLGLQSKAPLLVVGQETVSKMVSGTADKSAEPVVATTQFQSLKTTASGQGFNTGVTDGLESNAASIVSLQELTGSINAQAANQADKPPSSLSQAISGFPKVEGGASYQQIASVNLQTSVTTQVAAPGWGETVMQRVMWMSSQQVRSAEIQLDPPELGSLMVKINTVNDQTTVSFTSSHAVVRDALDQGLPRLRDLMNEQGLDLVDVDVSDHSNQANTAESDADTNGDESMSSNGRAASEAEPDELSRQQSIEAGSETKVGIINAYA
ncbi:MAG: flagellar hook-length control protein FliK [Pseudohongiellaceae bacterium]|jgi:flagellar hook-length control protein FliK